jgi:hypothetical protein
MNGRIDAERILDAFLAPEADRLHDRVLDAALDDIARTPQRRALRVPWRFPPMPALTRTTAMAAVVLVAAVGAGGLILLDSNSPGNIGGRPTPSPTQLPTAAASAAVPTPGASRTAIGITGWTNYTSPVHGFTLGYPDDWSLHAGATREWQAGDSPLEGEPPFADSFASPGDGEGQVGIWAWEMPAGEGADVESMQGLQSWARTFCGDIGDASCEASAREALPMCLDAGGDACRSAIIVPGADGTYAIFVEWTSALLTSMPDKVVIVSVGRPEGHPSTVRYGGATQLLKSILTTMGVHTPEPGQVPG